MLAIKRVRERAAVFVALAGVALVVSALGVGLDGYLANAETAGVRTELASRAGSDLALEVSLARDSAAAEQDANVRALLARVLPVAGTPAPLTVTRTVTSFSLLDDKSGRLVLLSLDDLDTAGVLVDGAWPASPSEVAVRIETAESLGLEVGDPLVVAGRTLIVAATFSVADPLDGRWLGDPTLVGEGNGTDFGPVVIDESLWDDLDVSPRARWTIVADPAVITPADLAQVVTGWDSLTSVARADDSIDTVTLEQSGRLASVSIELLSRIEALRAVAPVALIIIAAIGFLTVLELARLLATLRAGEYALMWARGSTALSLSGTAALETLAVTLPGAAAGVGLAALALAATVGVGAATVSPVIAWAVPAAVVVAIVGTVTVSTALAGRSLESRDTSMRTGRPGRAIGIGAVVLVALAAALATWQLRLYGSPVIADREGRLQIDPVGVSAPALLLVAVVLIALTVIVALAPAVMRRAQRSRGIRAGLVPRIMGRRMRLTAIPLVLCALATGQLVVAASYAATWDASFSQNRELRAGSALSIEGRGLTESVLARVAATDSVTAVAPLIVQNTPIGPQQASLVAVAPEAVVTLAENGRGIVDLAAVASGIAVDEGDPLGTDTVSVTVETSGLAEPLVMRALLTDDLGGLVTVPLTASGTEYSAPADPDSRLFGFEIDVPRDVANSPDNPPAFAITAGTIDLTRTWLAYSLGTLNMEQFMSGPGISLSLSVPGTLRIVAAPLDDAPPPLVISQLLADTANVRVGDTVPVVIDSRQSAVVTSIAAIVPAIPGAQRELAAAISITTVQRAVLGLYDSHPVPTQAWLGTTAPDTVPEALRTALPPRVAVVSLANDQARAILASASIALWIGAAGAGILALVALVAVVGAQLRSRRGEVVLLRALGVTAATTAALRRIELIASILAGLIAGAVAGALVAALTVPALARAAVPNAFRTLPTPAELAVIPVLLGFATFAAALAVLVVAYGASVARQSRRLGAREQAG